MDGEDIAILTILGILGVVSAATGFAAEGERLTPSQFAFCALPPNPALALALVAVLTLVIARIIIDISTRCICCTKKSQDPSTVYKIVAWLSWLAFLIALAVLMFGAVSSNRSPQEVYGDSGLECIVYYVKPGVFAVGACASVISVILGIVNYMSFSSGKKSGNQPAYPQGAYGTPGGITMGQPQFPPQPIQQPVGHPQGGIPMGQPQPQFPPQHIQQPAGHPQGGIPMGQPQFSPQHIQQPVGNPQGGIPMGHPEYPPQPIQQPV